jgi:parallel beta-helix repeat protein
MVAISSSTGGCLSSEVGQIIIIGEDELEAWIAINGFIGSGTVGSPYIISDLEIDGNGTSDCLYIEAVDVHVVIRNCSFHNATSIGTGLHVGSGLALISCANITVENVTSDHCRNGILLDGSKNCMINGSTFNSNNGCGAVFVGSEASSLTASNLSDNFDSGIRLKASNAILIEDNYVLQNDFGIYSESSTSCNFTSNRCIDNDDHGIRLDASTHCTIGNNEMALNDDGIFLTAGSDDNGLHDNAINDFVEYGIFMDWSIRNNCTGNSMSGCGFLLNGISIGSQRIDITNTVNDRSVIYLVDSDGNGKSIDGAGQIILSGVSNMTFKDSNLSDGTAGILMSDCMGIQLIDLTIERETYYGIRADSCYGCTLAEGIITDTINSIEIADVDITISDLEVRDCIYGTNALSGGSIAISNSNYIDVDFPITVDGASVELIGCNITGASSTIIVSNSRNVTIRDCGIIGSSKGIRIANCLEVGIINCRFDNIRSDGIELHNIYNPVPIIIQDNSMNGITGAGILMREVVPSDMVRSIVVGNSFVRCRDEGIVVDNAMMVDIVDNRFEGCSPGIDIVAGSYILIDRNAFSGDTIECYDEDVFDLNVTDRNLVDGHPMIFFVNRDLVEIDFNRRAGQVYLSSCNRIVLKDTVVMDLDIGYEIRDSSAITLMNVSAYGCKNGIGSIGVEGLSVIDSYFTGCDIGMAVNDSGHCDIWGSEIYANGIGLMITESDGWNEILVHDNLYRVNSGYAIWGDEKSRGVIVERNVFAYNRGSIDAPDTTKVQCYDAGYATWTGNYWLDHVDSSEGPEVMEVPYRLDGRGSSDQSPLRRIPASILPPPSSDSATAFMNGSILEVDWEPVTVRSLIPIIGYAIHGLMGDEPTYLAQTGQGGTNWISEEQIVSWESVVISSLSSLGESTYSVAIDLIETDPPMIIADIVSPRYFNTTFIRTSFDVIDESELIRVLITLDGIFQNQWPESDGTGGLPDLILERAGPKDVSYGIRTSFNVTMRSLIEGMHWLSIKAYDVHGNVGTWNGTFVVDLTAPIIHVSRPINGSVLTGPDLNISWSCTDAISGVNGISLLFDGGTRIDLGPNVGQYIASIGTGELWEGDNELIISATDLVGNEAKESVAFSISNGRIRLLDFSPRGEDIPVDETISARFSGSIVPDSLEITLSEETTGKDIQLYVVTYSDGMGFLAYHPVLDEGTNYTARMRVHDYGGNLIEKEWMFTTEKADIALIFYPVIAMICDVDNGPIKGVEVSEGAKIVATTDPNGSFRLMLPIGAHVLILRKEGYDDKELHFVVDRSDGDRDLGTIYMDRIRDEKEENGDLRIVMLSILIVAITLGIYLFIRSRPKAGYSEE